MTMKTTVSEDPFEDPFTLRRSPGTFVRPQPGARTLDGVPPTALGAEVAADAASPDSGLNPLVALANPLLAVVPRIRTTRDLADPAGLKESLAEGLREFDARARQQGIAPERAMAARYILCTLLDEAAAGTAWGGGGAWGSYSLLAMFHNEAFGGEKVFQLMVKLAENPAANRDLLELIYAALSLGFQGRYAVVEGGAAQLQAVRERLAQVVMKERGAYPRPLAEHWRGRAAPRRALLQSWLPLWVTGALAAVAIVALHLVLSHRLDQASDAPLARIHALGLPGAAATAAVAAPAGSAIAAPTEAVSRLAPWLRDDLRAGRIDLRDEPDRSLVTIRGDGLFEPASTRLDDEHEALLARIGRALAHVPGRVRVTGHTDNQPIRSLRFPSNWVLSEERAKAVREILVANGVPPARVEAEGQADKQPLAPNDSPTHRALNRRVEIVLVPARKGEPS